MTLRNRKILVTGHTGFKGSWMSLLLNKFENELFGFALPPDSKHGIFRAAKVNKLFSKSIYGDVRNLKELEKFFKSSKPEIVFHFAAQPLVSNSYLKPRDTIETNILGTANLLDCVRKYQTAKLVVIVTSDKCYLEDQSKEPLVESSSLGGNDVYSASKACQELIAQSYSKSFLRHEGISLITVRAGNVIGGGDWSPNRLIPDLMRALRNNAVIEIRHPDAVRPWQHVLEPIFGYLRAAEYSLEKKPGILDSWNFGPSPRDEVPVSSIIKIFSKFSRLPKTVQNKSLHFDENPYLALDSSKAFNELNWLPRWNLETAVNESILWYQAEIEGQNMFHFSQEQIVKYSACEKRINFEN